MFSNGRAAVCPMLSLLWFLCCRDKIICIYYVNYMHLLCSFLLDRSMMKWHHFLQTIRQTKSLAFRRRIILFHFNKNFLAGLLDIDCRWLAFSTLCTKLWNIFLKSFTWLWPYIFGPNPKELSCSTCFQSFSKPTLHKIIPAESW